MKVELALPHQRSVQHHGDAARLIVHRRERRHGARLDADQLPHQLGRSERESPGAEAMMHALEIDRRILQRADEKHAFALVAQKQVLRVRARDRSAQPARVGDGEERRMPHGRVLDAEPVEKSEEVVGGGGITHVVIPGRREAANPEPMNTELSNCTSCDNGSRVSSHRRTRGTSAAGPRLGPRDDCPQSALTKLWHGRCWEKLQSTCRGMLVMPVTSHTPLTTTRSATASNAALPGPRRAKSRASGPRNGRGNAMTFARLSSGRAITVGRLYQGGQYSTRRRA